MILSESWSKSLQKFDSLHGLTKVHSEYLGTESFLRYLGRSASFYILTATEQRVTSTEIEWLTKPPTKSISYSKVVNRIADKIHSLTSDSHVTIHPYVRMVTKKDQTKPNAWGKAVVSAHFVNSNESSLNQAG